MLITRECHDISLLPAVEGLIQRAFGPQEGRVSPPQGALREGAASLAEKLTSETLFVAELDGELAGCAWCRPDGDDAAYVGRMAVEPALQGRGIGRELLRNAIAWAHGRGAGRVTLEVRIELTENIAFFERHGFVITAAASHPGYDRPTYYRMELRL